MFEYKYKIELKNTEIVNLFGEGYFADKSTFWKSHQTSLNSLYDKTLETGFPIKITDLELNRIELITNINDFHIWLKINQPFNFSRINGK